MKVYQVTKSYFDGDHDHGYYRSPLFATREEAEKFLNMVMATKDKAYPDPDVKKWWWTDGWPCDDEVLVISGIKVLTECPKEIDNADDYLIITYT